MHEIMSALGDGKRPISKRNVGSPLTARYTCELGYQKVSGDESLTCDNHPVWLGEPLNCTGENTVEPLINRGDLNNLLEA